MERKFELGDIVTWERTRLPSRLWYVRHQGSDPYHLMISIGMEANRECYCAKLENLTLVCAAENRADIKSEFKGLDFSKFADMTTAEVEKIVFKELGINPSVVTDYSFGDMVKDQYGVMWEVLEVAPDLTKPIRVRRHLSLDSYDWTYFSNNEISMVTKASEKPVDNGRVNMVGTGEGCFYIDVLAEDSIVVDEVPMGALVSRASPIPSVGDTWKTKDGEIGKVTAVVPGFDCFFVDTGKKVPLMGDMVATDDGNEGLARNVDNSTDSFVLHYPEKNNPLKISKWFYGFNSVASCSSKISISCSSGCSSGCNCDTPCAKGPDKGKSSKPDSKWNAVCKCGAPAYHGLMIECSAGCEAY